MEDNSILSTCRCFFFSLFCSLRDNRVLTFSALELGVIGGARDGGITSKSHAGAVLSTKSVDANQSNHSL